MAGAKQNWSVSDTNTLLELLKEMKIVQRLDGRKVRNNELFIQVHERLKEAGIERTIEQIKNRWKSLKSAYYKAKTQNNRSGSDPSSFPFYSLMDDLMGERPLSNVPSNGVDVGFEEEESTPTADVTDDGITDDSSSEGGPESTEVSTDGGEKRKRSSSSEYAKAMCTWSTEQQAFMEKIQESQNRWLEEQQERRLQREERLLSRFIEESSRSNERLVGSLLDGLRAIIRPQPPAPPASPAPSYSSQRSYRTYSGSADFSQHRHNYSDDYNSDYTLQNL
ncbi:hypothetical protein WMY93_007956 [Mugilogobius chulae]|uniref:Myb/SANT-like DNA-binding domain-containing protein n=1 Tax=Mugilogobius chulae TaxID=88201 RepID=A0AAW0PEI4_9GOBI